MLGRIIYLRKRGERKPKGWAGAVKISATVMARCVRLDPETITLNVSEALPPVDIRDLPTIITRTYEQSDEAAFVGFVLSPEVWKDIVAYDSLLKRLVCMQFAGRGAIIRIDPPGHGKTKFTSFPQFVNTASL